MATVIYNRQFKMITSSWFTK